MSKKLIVSPAEAGLTRCESEVYKIVAAMQESDEVIGTADVAKAWDRSHSFAFRTLKALVAKGLLEQYDKYYRLRPANGAETSV